MGGLLINDCLTCIPGTKTFWHNLLEWFPSLSPITTSYIEYSYLAEYSEKEIQKNKGIKYVIRNGSYFRPLNTNCITISLIQDNHIHTLLFNMQMNVINTSTAVVFNSKYIMDKYNINDTIVKIVIPLGIDFDLFYPTVNKHPDVLPNSIIYIGSSTNYPKGFNIILDIIKNSNYNFCLVMKDDYSLSQLDVELHLRIRIFNRVDSNMVNLLINSCICGICTSYEETQHLSGIECAACNKPMIARAVGWYYDCKDDSEWGCIADDSNFLLKIQYVLDNLTTFTPITYVEAKYSMNICKEKWSNLIEMLLK